LAGQLSPGTYVAYVKRNAVKLATVALRRLHARRSHDVERTQGDALALDDLSHSLQALDAMAAKSVAAASDADAIAARAAA
jgi:hypothetical protein